MYNLNAHGGCHAIELEIYCVYAKLEDCAILPFLLVFLLTVAIESELRWWSVAPIARMCILCVSTGSREMGLGFMRCASFSFLLPKTTMKKAKFCY